MTGTIVSPVPDPCHRTIEMPSHTAPGAITLASSIHAKGEAVAVSPPPAVGVGNALVLGGGAGVFPWLFPLLPLPCADTGAATASVTMTPARTVLK